MTEQERALLTVVARWPRIEGEWALLVVVAALHGIAAFTLLAAPNAQLFTQGTRPVFALFPPPLWAVAFLIGSACAVMLLQGVTARRQLATWMTVLPTQAVWWAASVMAVSRGGGSAMGVVFLTAVLAFTAVTAWLIMVDAAATER
jgi:hypothetical protein